MSSTTTITYTVPTTKTGPREFVKPPLKHNNAEDNISWFPALTTYLNYAILILFGYLRDFLGKYVGKSRYFNGSGIPPKGYAPLLQDWENFYTRRCYHRIQDCWNRPIAGPPYAGKLPVILRNTSDNNCTLNVLTNPATNQPVIKECVNLGSYNYLGFADDWHRTCKTDVINIANKYPVSMCTSFAEGGYTTLHQQLEKSVANFLSKEDAVIFNMGWATNGLGIPAIAGKGCLIISDALNHNSIVAGARGSGAEVRVFRHNDINGLEALVRKAIIEGQSRTHRPWRKIIIAVEGIYSMEGEYVDLPGVVYVARKYKCYIYLDEAHSIGAMGPSGRGIVEYWHSKGADVSFDDIDIMMGTFTKSFGAMGGYIAGSKALVSHIRRCTAGFSIDNAMTPIVCQQIITSLAVIKSEGKFSEKMANGKTMGQNKLEQLRLNARHFRQGLLNLQLEVVGEEDSPVIPVLIYNPTKLAAFSRACLERNIASVVVGFPATPLVMARVRFCVSAGHTIQDLDKALQVIAEVSDQVALRYRNSALGF